MMKDSSKNLAASTVTVRGISKAFVGVQALDDVSFYLRAGEIHALCGENGAGKSTLIKILSGVYTPDSGTVSAWGRPLPPGKVQASEAAGISVIHQEATAFPELDAVDNIFVGQELSRFGGLLLDRPEMESRTSKLLERVGAQVDIRIRVGELSVAKRQQVAIARALSHQCRLLILDEPTASLSSRDTRVLFNILKNLRDDGVSVLYISHRLEEVLELADRVTVLRDGKRVSTSPREKLSEDDLIKLMVGRNVEELFSRREQSARRDRAVMEVTGLTRHGAFQNVSFSVHEGEILALAGLVGAGRSEVARSIFGLEAPGAGGVRLDGVPLRHGNVQEAIRRGMAMVAEDRQHEGLVLPMTVRENLCMVALRVIDESIHRNRGTEDALAREMAEKLSIRTAGVEAPADTLSGGNQQKTVIGKWLAAEPRFLILDEPTRGVDVGAKAEIHRLILELARNGVGTLLISSELPEVLALSDRILVMRSGSITGELDGDEATQEEILKLALPGNDTEPV